MIYTVTFNPALDYVIHMDKIELGSVNRTYNEELYYGGKGINVSIVLTNLKVENTALGFISGFTGKAIEAGVKDMGVTTDFIKLSSGFSRINVKIKADKETDINGRGPEIEQDKIEELLEKLENIREGDTVILAGNIPDSIPKDIYEQIMKRLQKKKAEFVVDATGELLVNVLKYKPFLIKPNNYELGEIFDKELKDKGEIVKCSKELIHQGAQNVLVSMAKDGAILVCGDGNIYEMGVPSGKVINSVGSGDSMVAGFVAGYHEKKDFEYALKLGTVCGSATAFSNGLAERDLIMKIFKTI